jgi:hypothetical protein
VKAGQSRDRRRPRPRRSTRFTIAPWYHPWGTKFRFHRVYQRPDRLVEQVAGDLADPAAVIAGFLGDSGHAAAQQPAS